MTHGVGQALEDEHAGPFTDDESIAAVVEWCRLATRRKGPKLREAHLGIKRIGARDTSADHRIGASGPELINCQFERVERRAASGVQREGHSPQPQRLGDDCGRQARRERIQRFDLAEGLVPVPRGDGRSQRFLERSTQNFPRELGSGLRGQHDVAEDQSGTTPIDRLGSRIAPRLAGRRQRQVEDGIQPVQEPLIQPGTHGVEPRNIHETTTGRIDMILEGDSSIEGLGRIDEPAAGGDLARGVLPVKEDRPELVGGMGAREAASDAHDCDRHVWFRHGIDRHRSARHNGGRGDQLVATERLVERAVDDAFI